MSDSLRPVSASPVPCKICGGAAELHGVADFNKSCAEILGLRLPLRGVPVYYHRCTACQFMFTEAFDDWNTEQFKTHIYNDGYKTIDPDYEDKRPRANADVVAKLWNAVRQKFRVLDYGGGNDIFCSVLRERGFAVAVTYDPMVPEFASRPDGKYDLVTSFETLEHLPDPNGGIALMLEFVAEQGLVFFSTFARPADTESLGMNWWYIGPRNGHISIFTRQSLAHAFGRHGYKIISLSDNVHLAFRTLPPYLAHLQDQVAVLGGPSEG